MHQVKRKPIHPSQGTLDNEPCLPFEPAREPLLVDRDQYPDNVVVPTNHTKESGSEPGVDEMAFRHPDPRPQGSGAETRSEEAMTEKRRGNARRGGWQESTWRIVDGWWQEFLSCALGIVAFITLVVILRKSDGKPLSNWPSGITLNTVIAFLSTISRIAFIVPVTEGLAQAKWIWFKRPRPLNDFEIFNQASKGPWGSFNLLTRTKGWYVVCSIVFTSVININTGWSESWQLFYSVRQS